MTSRRRALCDATRAAASVLIPAAVLGACFAVAIPLTAAEWGMDAYLSARRHRRPRGEPLYTQGRVAL